MIRLTTILKEALAERNNSYAWMDTDGKFYPVLGRETHADWANRYLNRDKYGNITQQHDSIMQMWKKGWMRIANDGDTLYAHNETILPNRKQLKELIDLAIEYNFSKVVGDAGEDYKILWTEHDQLNENKDVSKLKATIESWKKVKEGDVVNGLKVRKDIPNTSSIQSTLNDYEVMGVREVPMNIFSIRPGESKLAQQIKESGEINPLIIIVDGDPAGLAYILEGSHRIDALRTLGVKTFPALVVLDTEILG